VSDPIGPIDGDESGALFAGESGLGALSVGTDTECDMLGDWFCEGFDWRCLRSRLTMLSMECVLECKVSLGLPAGLREVIVLDIVAPCFLVSNEMEYACRHTSHEVGTRVASESLRINHT
jgi:hypothetical protein